MATANFAGCLAFTLGYEGGRADDPRDPGGRTNQGVTQRTYRAWRAARGQPAHDVFAMTAEERDAIYRKGFWDAVKADSLPAGVDLAVFDLAVNSGPARALTVLAAHRGRDGAATVRLICAARLSFLHALGSFRAFGRGWTARVAACEVRGVGMAEQARIGLPVDAPLSPQVAGSLHAAGRAAGARAKRRKTGAGVLVTTGVVAHPAASAATGMSWPAAVTVAILILSVAALMLWRGHQDEARAAAYTAAA